MNAVIPKSDCAAADAERPWPPHAKARGRPTAATKTTQQQGGAQQRELLGGRREAETGWKPHLAQCALSGRNWPHCTAEPLAAVTN